MARFQSFWVVLVMSLSMAQAQAQLFDGKTLKPAVVTELTSPVAPGTILILGENHGIAAHRDQHVLILNQLRAQGLKVSVGLEFVNYTDQAMVDLYRAGSIDEASFLKNIGWGQPSFDYYREQLNFPRVQQGGFSLGLNLPRAIASKISKSGVGRLDGQEALLMPPHFEVGRDSYKQRFWEAAGQHCPDFEFCFAAQSAWDDTMAWTAANFIQAHPEQVLVIIVGEFHAQFGGGLADRIRKRFPAAKIKILSQIWAEGLTDADIAAELQPSPVEGPRGDFIWVSKP